MVKHYLTNFSIVAAASLSAALLLSPVPAIAALLQGDLLNPGDQLLTIDDDTELEWLDLTATAGLSFEEVMAGAGGFTDLGFRYATLSEVEGLFAAANIVDLFGTPTSTDSDSVFTNLSDLQALIGVTASSGGADPVLASNGIHLPDAGSAPPSVLDIVATVTGGPSEIALIDSTTIDSDEGIPNLGSFLVRGGQGEPNPVPEPGAVLGLGAMALAVALTTRKVSDRKDG